MTDSTDMSTPVTRGELQDTLGLFQQELRMERQHEIQAVVAPLATKAELQAAIAPLATKAELQAAIAPLATKAELHHEIQAAIAPLATKAELHHEIQTAIAPLATKAELELWGGALLARIRQGEQRIGNVERGQQHLIELVQQTQQQLQQTEQRLLAELARHTSAVYESMRTQIKASTEPFDDLPGRVNRLETEVFGPAPRDRRTRRRSR